MFRRISAALVTACLVAVLLPVLPAGAAGIIAPIGGLDRVAVGPGGAAVGGWALDKDGSDWIMVHVYVDGAFAGGTRADDRRSDVGAVHGYGNYHGFNLRVPVSKGRHRICVVAINDGPGANTTLGCRSVVGYGDVHKPIGAIDRIDVVGNRVTVSGWALDPDTSDSIRVGTRVDGSFGGSKLARGTRSDLAARFGRGPAHGYGFAFTLADGQHRICVTAVDDARLAGFSTRLGCRTFTVGAGTGGGGRGNGAVVSPSGVVLPVLATLASGWQVRTPCANTINYSGGTYVAGVDVVLDAGHGGSESGAVGSNGLTERRLNLIIAKKTRDMLEARGYSVLLTRSTDIRIPLSSRGAIAESVDPNVFVSIHHNGGAVATRGTPGTEVFYQHDSADSKRLSGILYEHLFAAMDRYNIVWTYGWRAGVNTRVTSAGADYYGIHRYTPNVPSSITEPGYLSNPAEAALFARADVQDAEAAAIADGVQRYLNTNDPGSGYRGSFTDPYTTGTGGTSGCVDPPLG